MKRLPQFLNGQKMFIDGFGIFGTVKTVELPPVEEITESIISGGFEKDVGTGIFKAMKPVFTFTEYHPMVYTAARKAIANPVYVLKGNIKQDGQACLWSRDTKRDIQVPLLHLIFDNLIMPRTPCVRCFAIRPAGMASQNNVLKGWTPLSHGSFDFPSGASHVGKIVSP